MFPAVVVLKQNPESFLLDYDRSDESVTQIRVSSAIDIDLSSHVLIAYDNKLSELCMFNVKFMI